MRQKISKITPLFYLFIVFISYQNCSPQAITDDSGLQKLEAGSGGNGGGYGGIVEGNFFSLSSKASCVEPTSGMKTHIQGILKIERGGEASFQKGCDMNGNFTPVKASTLSIVSDDIISSQSLQMSFERYQSVPINATSEQFIYQTCWFVGTVPTDLYSGAWISKGQVVLKGGDNSEAQSLIGSFTMEDLRLTNNSEYFVTKGPYSASYSKNGNLDTWASPELTLITTSSGSGSMNAELRAIIDGVSYTETGTYCTKNE